MRKREVERRIRGKERERQGIKGIFVNRLLNHQIKLDNRIRE